MTEARDFVAMHRINPDRVCEDVQRYRPDIDGLRALAVIVVVMFHADIPGFAGGYVGVDVFFVISGFLITNIILSDLWQAKFTIRNFYERRIRRIFPALFTMMLLCWLCAYWLFLPQAFAEFGTSTVWATLFLSNIHFWQLPSYFADTAEMRPLVHTWSLAVEEQFYILYPIALIVLFRFGLSRLRSVIVLCFGASLVVSAWATLVHPQAAFYLAPSRAWELLFGAILALEVVPKVEGAGSRSVLTFIGILLILYSVHEYTAMTPFPGLAALLPCLGTALIIHGGRDSATGVSRLLGWRPVVFIGLISYSLYLWHWPVLVMFRHYMSVQEIPPLARFAAVALSVALAILSWWYVERPFRHSRRIPGRVVAIGGASIMALTVTIGVVGFAFDGIPHRFDKTVIDLAAATQDLSPEGRSCLNQRTPDAVRKGQMCEMKGAGAAKQTFVLWGDSHAAALASAIDKAAARTGRSGLMALASTCPPLVGVTSVSGGRDFSCVTFNDAVMSAVRADADLKVVILDANWALYATGTSFKNGSRRNLVITDNKSGSPGTAENKMVFVRGLRRSLAALTKAGKRVVIVGPTPEIGWDVPQTLATQRYTGRHWRISPTYDEFLRRQAFVIPTLIKLAKDYGARMIFPHKVLCDSQRCFVKRDKQVLYIDDNHLSLAAADKLYQIFVPALQQAVCCRAAIGARLLN